jgi:type IV secretory pathway protease TraF
MKPVVARARDSVRLSERGVTVNGRAIPNSAPLLKDTANRLLSSWPYGTYTVQPGTIWVVSGFHPRSFDSRYFGPIPEALVRNYVRPLLALR